MPSNKTSLYDGHVHIFNNGTLDLTGKIGLADGAYSAGDTTLTYDEGTVDFVAGDEVYGCEANTYYNKNRISCWELKPY